MAADFWTEHRAAHHQSRFFHHDGLPVIVEDQQRRRLVVACHDNHRMSDATVDLELGDETIKLRVVELLYALAVSCGRELRIDEQGAELGKFSDAYDARHIP